jgi:hypothetical protein
LACQGGDFGGYLRDFTVFWRRPRDRPQRKRSLDEEIREERRPGRDGVAVEVGDARRGEDLVVEEEVSGVLAGGAGEDRVGGVGEDLGLAALLARGVARRKVARRVAKAAPGGPWWSSKWRSPSRFCWAPGSSSGASGP